MNSISHISYQIDEADDIVFVSDAWSEFALRNGAPHLPAEKVLKRNLWKFIADAATREIYRKLVEKARGGRVIKFDFRCDSTDTRRFSAMTISLLENKNIQFDSRIVRSEKRLYQNVFQTDARRNDSVIVACSWCKKIETEDGGWQEIEDAAASLKIFETENMPQLSHGMCASCYQSITANHRETFHVETAKI